MNRLTIQLDEIRAADAAEPHSTMEKRLERIGRVEAMLRANEEKLCKAVAANFGHRHPMETQLAELSQIYQACRYTKKHLKEWLKPIHQRHQPTCRARLRGCKPIPRALWAS
jgi:coniferyl-aldehyde dehydrogenase